MNWLITVTRLSFVYFLIIKIWKKREKKSNVVSIIVSIFVIVLGLVVIVPDDVAASIIAAVCLFVMLTKLYPDKRRAIVNILLLEKHFLEKQKLRIAFHYFHVDLMHILVDLLIWQHRWI